MKRRKKTVMKRKQNLWQKEKQKTVVKKKKKQW